MGWVEKRGEDLNLLLSFNAIVCWYFCTFMIVNQGIFIQEAFINAYPLAVLD